MGPKKRKKKANPPVECYNCQGYGKVWQAKAASDTLSPVTKEVLTRVDCPVCDGTGRLNRE